MAKYDMMYDVRYFDSKNRVNKMCSINDIESLFDLMAQDVCMQAEIDTSYIGRRSIFGCQHKLGLTVQRNPGFNEKDLDILKAWCRAYRLNLYEVFSKESSNRVGYANSLEQLKQVNPNLIGGLYALDDTQIAKFKDYMTREWYIEFIKQFMEPLEEDLIVYRMIDCSFSEETKRLNDSGKIIPKSFTTNLDYAAIGGNKEEGILYGLVIPTGTEIFQPEKFGVELDKNEVLVMSNIISELI